MEGTFFCPLLLEYCYFLCWYLIYVIVLGERTFRVMPHFCLYNPIKLHNSCILPELQTTLLYLDA